MLTARPWTVRGRGGHCALKPGRTGRLPGAHRNRRGLSVFRSHVQGSSASERVERGIEYRRSARPGIGTPRVLELESCPVPISKNWRSMVSGVFAGRSAWWCERRRGSWPLDTVGGIDARIRKSARARSQSGVPTGTTTDAVELIEDLIVSSFDCGPRRRWHQSVTRQSTGCWRFHPRGSGSRAWLTGSRSDRSASDRQSHDQTVPQATARVTTRPFRKRPAGFLVESVDFGRFECSRLGRLSSGESDRTQPINQMTRYRIACARSVSRVEKGARHSSRTASVTARSSWMRAR